MSDITVEAIFKRFGPRQTDVLRAFIAAGDRPPSKPALSQMVKLNQIPGHWQKPFLRVAAHHSIAMTAAELVAVSPNRAAA